MTAFVWTKKYTLLIAGMFAVCMFLFGPALSITPERELSVSLAPLEAEAVMGAVAAVTPVVGAIYATYQGIKFGADATAAAALSTLDTGIAKVFSWIGYLILTVFSFFLWLAGVFLNTTIYFTILQMNTFITDNATITHTWTIVRDVANIAFIFVLIYTGVLTIIDKAPDIQRTIVRVIIAALLINFSFFFTQVIIDASNVLTIQFYNAIGAGNSQTIDGGLATAFMENLQVTSLYNPETGRTQNTVMLTGETEHASAIFARILGSSIFILLTAVILFTTAVMLAIRFVILIILLIFSPIAFVGMILPKAGVTKKWWKALQEQAIFAPVLMFMLFITLQVTENINTYVGGTGSGSSSATLDYFASAGMASFNIVLAYFIAFVFLVASIVVAKMAGGSAADMGTKWGSKLAFGTLGFAGRNTVGRIGSGLAQSERLEKMANESNSKIVRGASRLGIAAGATAATSSFDVRNAPGASKVGGLTEAVSGGLGKKINLVGNGTKDKGLVQRRQKRDKDLGDRAKERAKAFDTSPVEIDRAEERLRQAEQQLKEAERLYEDAGTSSQSDELIQSTIDAATDRVTRAREEVDNLKGVSEKDAKKRGVDKKDSISAKRKKDYFENIAFSILTRDRLAKKNAVKKDVGGSSLEEDLKELFKKNKLAEESKDEKNDEKTESDSKNESEDKDDNESTS